MGDIAGKCHHPCVNLNDSTFLSTLPHAPTLIANASDVYPLAALLPITHEPTSTFDVHFVRLFVLGAATLNEAPLDQQSFNRLNSNVYGLHGRQDASSNFGNTDLGKRNELAVVGKSAWIRTLIVSHLPVLIHLKGQCVRSVTAFEKS